MCSPDTPSISRFTAHNDSRVDVICTVWTVLGPEMVGRIEAGDARPRARHSAVPCPLALTSDRRITFASEMAEYQLRTASEVV
ncbi:hypothetical protein A6452_16755 [Bradyrhizobium elkanii]|nr:hypothetical protein A6452_16755 [Bradyrhizobium elkanii]